MPAPPTAPRSRSACYNERDVSTVLPLNAQQPSAPAASGMRDQYGREIRDLRVSLTDRCNLRCVYCMPEEMLFKPHAEILTDDELLVLVRAAAELGVRKIRLTGGEPTVRRSEEHTSELQSHSDLVCRLLLEKKKFTSAGKHARGVTS